MAQFIIVRHPCLNITKGDVLKVYFVLCLSHFGWRDPNTAHLSRDVYSLHYIWSCAKVSKAETG